MAATYCIPLVQILACLVQRVSIVDGELGQNQTSSKTSSMERNIVSKNSIEDFELLDSLICCLMSSSDSCPDIKLLRVLIMNHAPCNFSTGGILADVSIIRLYSLAWIKHMLEEEPEDVDVWPISTRQGTNTRNNIACEDAKG